MLCKPLSLEPLMYAPHLQVVLPPLEPAGWVFWTLACSEEHLSALTTVNDEHTKLEVTGFDGKGDKTTTGRGSLGMRFHTPDGDATLILSDAHRIDIPKDLISLGKLIKDGYEFHASSPHDMFVQTPCGTTVPVSMGDRNSLMLEYTALPTDAIVRARFVGSSAKKRTYRQLHQIFGHAGFARVLATLKVTHGIKTTISDLEDFFCPVCALANSLRKAISKTPHATPRRPAKVLRELDGPPPPPWMVTYSDIKSLPVPSRAGSKYAIFFVDAAFTFIFVYPVKGKYAAHAAADKFIVNAGLHKLPYKCTILTDGCGSCRGVDGNFAGNANT